eukprot:g4097.t1
MQRVYTWKASEEGQFHKDDQDSQAMTETSTDPDHQAPGLYIGPLMAARWPPLLLRKNIKSVVSLVGESITSRGTGAILPLWHSELTFLVFDVEDDDSTDLYRSGIFEKAIQFTLDSFKKGQSILVHCIAGRSRSATVVASILVRLQKCTADRALQNIRKIRPFIDPNPYFVKCLHEFARNEPMYTAKNDCELCFLEKRTKWFRETPEFLVVECDQCDQPMVLYRGHTMLLSEKEEERMEAILTEVANGFFGHEDWFLDKKQRTITTHLHWHARGGPMAKLQKAMMQIRRGKQQKRTSSKL